MMDKNVVELIELAYDSELNGVNLYTHLFLKGYNESEFDDIKAIRLRGCELLKQAGASYKINLKDEMQAPIFVPDRLDDALIVALNYEISITAFYAKVCEQCDDEALRDLFFRLWATSENEFIPALKLKLSTVLACVPNIQNLQNQISDTHKDSKNEIASFLGGDINGYQEEFADLNQKLNHIVNGNASQSEVKELLNHRQFAFFSGAALGALGLSAFMKSVDKDKQND